MNQPIPMNQKERKLAQDISEITQELTVDNNNLVRMPESWFVATFLPFFAGEQVHHNVNPETWFNVVHGPFNEAIVVDGQGQELYRVPAFYEQGAINAMDGTGKSATLPSVTNMMLTAQNYSGMHHADAVENVIAYEMERRSFIFNPDIDNSAVVDRWNAIFARYGKTPIKKGSVSATAAAAPADIARDSSEFDPL